jgi:hypothetical protein
MRNSRSVCAIVAHILTLACLFLLVTAHPADAQPSATATMMVNAEATFMRDQPDTKGNIVLRLERGALVDVLDSSGTWFRVRAGDPPREGYIHGLVLAPASRVITPAAEPRPRPQPRERTESGPVERRAPGTAPPTAQPRRLWASGHKTPIGFRLLGSVGWTTPLARESFEAVGVSGSQQLFGGGGEVTNLFGGLFVRASFERWKATGERAFIAADGRRFGLGIPLSLKMTPIEATAGWRFKRLGRGLGSLAPYAGGGGGIVRYEETDPFADATESIDEQFGSYHALGGVEVGLLPWLGVQAEYRYRWVPDSLGSGGVSAILGDDSIGGSTVAVSVVVGR